MADLATPNLPSRDFEATSRFYGALGFTESWRDDGWMDGPPPRRAHARVFPYADLDPLESSFSCCLRLDQLDRFYATCKARDCRKKTAGQPRLQPPRDESPGLCIAYMVDLDGTLVRLIQNG